MSSSDQYLGSFSDDHDATDSLRVGYYEHLADGNPNVPQGELVYVTRWDENRVYLLLGDKSLHLSRESFEREFEYAPDGEERRNAEIQHLVAEGQRDRLESVELQKQMLQNNPQLLLEAGEDDASGADTEERLVLVGDQKVSAPEAREKLRTFRNQILKFEGRMKARTERVNALLAEARERVLAQMKEQQAALMAQMKGLTEMVKKAEEVMWTISLYLGSKETIVRLRDGKPASQEEPIALFQATKYMDEECAIADEDSGGIDFTNIDLFDQWLLEGNHLDQVCPTQKGVVAFQVRRKAKRYTFDPLADAEMNKENFKTYFLMRNGEKVYRIHTDLFVGSTLTPRMNEFDQLFMREEYDRTEGGYRKVRLKPGSDDYMKAMEAADNRQKHYMRVMLFLQGLLDRTPIFQPLPAPRINILDIRNQDRYIRFINDAETDHLLPADRPSFRDWVREINSQLEVGHRVVGCFNHWTHGLRKFESERRRSNSRISPDNAAYPPSDDIYALEKRAPGGGFYLYYDRNKAGDWSWHEFQKRARCEIRRDDEFVLNFDLATEEDLEFYLKSRLNRHDYEHMHPILKLAIKLKQQERADEAPFREALMGALMREYNIPLEAAEEEIDDLISWWKTKNKIHRALRSGEDELASRQIIEEFRLRREREAARDKYPTDVIVARILEAEPDAIFIAHKANNQFVARIPENERNIFFREQVWNATLRGSVRLSEEKRWRTPDKRSMRWHVYHASERWDSWRQNIHPAAFLTDPEIEQFHEDGWERVERLVAELTDRSGRRRDEDEFVPETRPIRLSAIFDSDLQSITYWVWLSPALAPSERLLTNKIHKTKALCVTLNWERENGVPVPKLHYSNYRTEERLEVNPMQVRVPWQSAFEREMHNGSPQPSEHVLWCDAEAIRAFKADQKVAVEAEKERERLSGTVQAFSTRVHKEMKKRVYDAEFARFMDEYGDEELWEGHLKSIKLPESPYPDRFRNAASLLVERDIEIAGRSVGEVIEMAMRYGYKPHERDRDKDQIPLDFVLPPLE